VYDKSAARAATNQQLETTHPSTTPGRFLLTGSTRLLSTPKLSETLAGRVEIIDLWPLSAGERGGVQTAFIDSLLTGAFADLVPAKLPRTAYLDMIAEAPLGQLFENYVAMELIRYLPNSSSAPKLFHFRDRDGVEVNFVLQTRRGIVAGVEVKASNSVSSSDFKGLRYLHAKLGDKFAGGVVLYTGDQVVPFGAKLWAAPMSILWS
jgi:predicted AAA+ superfamily ATPase